MASEFKQDTLIFGSWALQESLDSSELGIFENGIQNFAISSTGIPGENISFDPSGTQLSSNNVQTAIAEVSNDTVTSSVSNGFSYIYDYNNSVSDTDHGLGNFWLDNTTIGSATTISLSNYEKENSLDISTLLNLIKQDSFIYIQRLRDATEYCMVQLVNTTVTQENGYVKFTNPSVVNSTITEFENNKPYILSFRTVSGSNLMGMQIPALPKSGSTYNLQYDVTTGSLSWVSV